MLKNIAQLFDRVSDSIGENRVAARVAEDSNVESAVVAIDAINLDHPAAPVAEDPRVENDDDFAENPHNENDDINLDRDAATSSTEYPHFENDDVVPEDPYVKNVDNDDIAGEDVHNDDDTFADNNINLDHDHAATSSAENPRFENDDVVPEDPCVDNVENDDIAGKDVHDDDDIFADNNITHDNNHSVLPVTKDSNLENDAVAGDAFNLQYGVALAAEGPNIENDARDDDLKFGHDTTATAEVDPRVDDDDVAADNDAVATQDPHVENDAVAGDDLNPYHDSAAVFDDNGDEREPFVHQYECDYCAVIFPTYIEAEQHEECCAKRPVEQQESDKAANKKAKVGRSTKRRAPRPSERSSSILSSGSNIGDVAKPTAGRVRRRSAKVARKSTLTERSAGSSDAMIRAFKSSQSSTNTIIPSPELQRFVGVRVYAEYPENQQWYWGIITSETILKSHSGVKSYQVWFDDGDVGNDIPGQKIITEKEYNLKWLKVFDNKQPPKRPRHLNVYSIEDGKIIIPSETPSSDAMGTAHAFGVTSGDDQNGYDDDENEGSTNLHLKPAPEPSNCRVCLMCTRPDCQECAVCKYNCSLWFHSPESRDQQQAACFRKMCLYIPVDQKAQPAVGFPKGWRFYYTSADDITLKSPPDNSSGSSVVTAMTTRLKGRMNCRVQIVLISPTNTTFRSVDAAILAYPKAFAALPDSKSHFYDHVGSNDAHSAIVIDDDNSITKNAPVQTLQSQSCLASNLSKALLLPKQEQQGPARAYPRKSTTAQSESSSDLSSEASNPSKQRPPQMQEQLRLLGVNPRKGTKAPCRASSSNLGSDVSNSSKQPQKRGRKPKHVLCCESSSKQSTQSLAEGPTRIRKSVGKIHRQQRDLSATKEIGSRVYCKYTNGLFYWGKINDKTFDESSGKNHFSVEFDDGDFIKNVSDSEDTELSGNIYTELGYFNQTTLLPPRSTTATGSRVNKPNKRKYQRTGIAKIPSCKRPAVPTSVTEVLQEGEVYTLSQLYDKRCKTCSTCIQKDCMRCASCVDNRYELGESTVCCLRKMCSKIPLNLKKQPALGFPPNWTFASGVGPDVVLISPMGFEFTSVIDALDRCSDEINDLDQAMFEFEDHVGGSIFLNDDSHFLVGRNYCHEWTDIQGRNKLLYGRITNCVRDKLDNDYASFTVTYNTESLHDVTRMRPFCKVHIRPTVELDFKRALGGLYTYNSKLTIPILDEPCFSISCRLWLTPNMRFEEMVESLGPHEKKLPRLTLVWNSIRLQFSVHESSIPNAGRGVFVECTALSPGCPELRLKKGHLLDLGVYAPCRDEDLKEEFVFLVKNFILGMKCEEWAFDAGPAPKTNQVDITDDWTGELHEIGAHHIPAYVNECRMEADPVVHAEHDPEGIVHYLLGSTKSDFVLPTDGSMMEIFTNYGPSYERVRVRKKYSFLEPGEQLVHTKSLLQENLDYLEEVAGFQGQEVAGCVAFLTRMVYHGTLAAEFHKNTLCMTLALYLRGQVLHDENICTDSPFDLELAQVVSRYHTMLRMLLDVVRNDKLSKLYNDECYLELLAAVLRIVLKDCAEDEVQRIARLFVTPVL